MPPKVIKHFKKSDPILFEVIKRIGAIDTPTGRKGKNYFLDLIESIVSQQLSGKAAGTILARFRALYGSRRFPMGWAGQNNSGYSNPEFDEACQAAREALPGGPGYVEHHRRAQEIFAEDLPAIPLFQPVWATAARADFCGHQMDPTAYSDTWNIEVYDYGEGCEGQ